jgi:DNA polymerase-3 subunit delta'
MRISSPKVDEIRTAVSFISQKPVDSAYKTVLIEGADDMNASAANSLLKTLEEPPGGSVIILLARSASGVLPTIASRCSVIQLSPEADIEEKISGLLGVDKDMARILADLSGGFLDEAERIYKNNQIIDQRSKILDISDRLLAQKNYAISSYSDFFDGNKDDVLLLLGIMQSYYHDISMLQKTGNKTLLANPDCIDSIKRYAQRFTTGAISNIIKVILEAERRFSYAVNFRLAAEKMLFDILEEKNRWLK